MSPHLTILLAALLLAWIAKLAFPQSTLRILATIVFGLPLAVLAALGETPSLLGLAIVLPIAAFGAVAGVAGGGWMSNLLRTRGLPRGK